MGHPAVSGPGWRREEQRWHRSVFDQVTKTYRGGVNGVDDLSLDIADGEVIVLVAR